MKRPTQKQITTIQLISKGMSPRQAMIKAGYSEGSAGHPKKNLLSKPQVLTIIDQMKLTLQQGGIDGIYLAKRLEEFARSDNAKVFYGAYDRISKIVGIEPSQSQLTPTRSITFNEWIESKPTVQVTETN